MTEELKPIDVSRFTVTENGNVIRSKAMTEEPKKNHWYEMYELECLKTKGLQADKERLTDKVNNLEGQKEFWKQSSFDWRHKFFKKRLVKRLVAKDKQLNEAKEIIREFTKYEINEYDGSLEIHFEELKKQAEAFLKE